MKLLIVGGSDAGISAGLRARQLRDDAEVTLLLEDEYPNFSFCGLPFFISGETPDWRSLAHRTLNELEAAGLTLRMATRATSINVKKRQVEVEAAGGHRGWIAYDRLVVATGAVPIRPPIDGLELPGVHTLHTVDDSRRVQEQATAARNAVIVGGGYIGLEMADALRHRGLEVDLVEMAPQVMTSVDPSLADVLAAEMDRRGVRLRTGVTIDRIEAGEQLKVSGSSGFASAVDLVIVVAGVRPNTELAASAGIQLGVKGAIRVNQRMETTEPHVYAAGDCVETLHRLLPEPTYLPLGTTAHKQGRVAGENALGGTAEFAGSLGTQVVKVFDLAVARTGLRDADGEAAGFTPVTFETQEWDHKRYYPGANRLRIRYTGDARTGSLLGAQIVGDHRAQVAKRIDIFAAALYSGLKVEDLLDLDLSYTPPFSAPWDPVQVAAQGWLDRFNPVPGP